MFSSIPPSRYPLTPLAWACLALTSPAWAQTAAPTADVLLPKQVISASRAESTDDAAAATITTKEAKDIERAQARDLKSLLDNEPGVSVRLQPARMSAVFGATGRGGNEGINIRGLEGNQVLLQVDGVRLPLAWDSGPYVAGRGDYIDVEAFKRVELLRGPASASYGSDGLAGAVSFLTKDPVDLLTLGQPTQASLKLGYASADRSWVAVPSLALRTGPWEAMLLASVRRGQELSNQGEADTRNWNATTPNPQDRRSDYVLGKAVYKLNAQQQIKLTLEALDRQTTTDPIYTVVGMPFVNSKIIDARAQENISRQMGKLDWQYQNMQHPWVQRLSAWVWAQGSENHQFGQERYTYTPPTTPWAKRTRDTTFAEAATGLGFQAESQAGQDVAHRLIWGADLSKSRITSLKEGAHYDAADQLITSGSASASTSLPNQSFPNSDNTSIGLFAQDEISVGAWRITPALRWDRFDITPEVGNPLFTRTNGVPPSKLSSSAMSPRLGLSWQWLALVQPYAQVAKGFRAPTPWQINGGVSNATANPPYRSIGNPDLKPERSTSYELGLKGRDGLLRWSAAVFKSEYRDFIISNADVTATTSVPLDPGMAPTTRTFQSINAARAEISGFELGATWSFQPRWSIEARYAHAKGDQWDQAGAVSPLSTIEPDKATLGLRYERKQAFGGELMVTAQKSQGRPHANGLYIPKGYVVADLTAWWDITPQWQLNAALSNLADVKYSQWSDVRGLAATSTLADAYTQPGRNISVSVRTQF